MNASQSVAVLSMPYETAILARKRRAAENRPFVEIVRKLPPVRQDKVRRMRSLIARGKLATPERLEETARRLLKELMS
jgi:hypothetical protein